MNQLPPHACSPTQFQRNYAVCQDTFQVGIDTCGEYQQQRVAVGVKKDLEERIIVENRSDLADHPYLQVLDVWELDSNKKKKRKTYIINVYDN